MPILPKEGANILTGCSVKPDLGALKRTSGEYAFLQNIRGRGRRVFKRTGVQSFASLNYGIMGMFDLKEDDDVFSPDLFLVWDNNGSLTTYGPTELITTFTFTYDFTTGGALYLQSPDLNWWNITLDTTPLITVTGVAAPGTTISTDLIILQSQLLGFKDSTGQSRLYIEDGTIKTKRYAPASALIFYSTIQAFVTGKGPVFVDLSSADRWRLEVLNGGILAILGV